jgi:hypothetical protein
MKKLASIALAAALAVTGMLAPAHAALSDRDAPVWHAPARVERAAREGGKGGRNDGARNARHDKKGDKVIWRIRAGKHRPFWRFRRDRGEDCFVRKMQVEDSQGNLRTRNVRICD